uniref:rRNA adenine N(6)-methyltransferase n=1 Tax=Blastobotrys adeninivorans TaxID=409370 RepID=A0A060TD45_BLAAD
MRVKLHPKPYKDIVKSVYGRKSVINYEKLCTEVTKHNKRWGYGDNTVIIDAYPGFGVFSAALQEAIRPKKHLMMEPHIQYHNYLQSLADPSVNTLEVLKWDPFRWTSFSELQDNHLYTPQMHTREEVHPDILFVANLTMPQGDQLLTQYLNCVQNGSWLQRYGRVRMLLWVKPVIGTKFMLREGMMGRSRLSVQAEACTDSQMLSTSAMYKGPANHDAFEVTPAEVLPPTPSFVPQLLEVTPKPVMPDHLDSFDYVIRMLFILNTKPLRESLAILGPGALEQLGPQVEDILETPPRDLPMEQIYRVVRVFHEWPFKPDVLFDFFERELP